LLADGATDIVERGVLPINFACPSLLLEHGASRIGISDAASPWSAALAQA
jgi:gamma-glutamyltranspeptidase/glutathione hydrolase